MPISFDITRRALPDGTPVVAVAGEIDLFTAPEFKEAVMSAIDASKGGVVVDLSETRFIDSSSLGVLIGAHRRASGRGGTLAVVCGSDPIANTFHITGLDGVFTPVEETVDSFEQLVNGDLDDLPEQAFFNVGNADSAREKAKTLTEEEKKEGEDS